MTSTDQPEIPSEWIERGAPNLLDHEPEWMARGYGRYSWFCLCGEGSGGALESIDAAGADYSRHVAAAFLTAVLDGCEVRTEEGMRLTWVEGPNAGHSSDQWDGREKGWARNAVPIHEAQAEVLGDAYLVRATLIRRLVITTQPEAVPVEETR